MPINPIRLYGPWDEGYALDVHTKTSKHAPDHAYSYPVYETEYTKLGKLLHYLKYRNEIDKLSEIMKIAEPFIKSWDAIKEVNLVIPAPFSKLREYQAADEIAKAIADLINTEFSDQVLYKDAIDESKIISSTESRQIIGTIHKKQTAKKEYNILLVDDFYDSGSTLTECVRILREDKNIKKIYVLTITKMRRE
jgi:predicted amidophosphoribosyltransferase